MPLLVINLSSSLDPNTKRRVGLGCTELVKAGLGTSETHIHVHVADGQFISFAGSCDTPAAYVAVHCADNFVDHAARKLLVEGMVGLLTKYVNGLAGDRIYMLFHELPVERLAVGSSIMDFPLIHTAPSVTDIHDTHMPQP